MSERYLRAVAYAGRLHRNQRRKGSGCPYLAHLLAVSSLVMEAGGSEDECIAGLLHDAVEDQGGPRTAREIRERFGGTVARIVEACTEDWTAGPGWLDRKSAALARVRERDASARLVLTADKLHNARSLVAEFRAQGDRLWAHFRGGRDGTLWYFREMARELRATGGNPLLGELERVVDELGQLVGDAEGR